MTLELVEVVTSDKEKKNKTKSTKHQSYTIQRGDALRTSTHKGHLLHLREEFIFYYPFFSPQNLCNDT